MLRSKVASLGEIERLVAKGEELLAVGEDYILADDLDLLAAQIERCQTVIDHFKRLSGNALH